MHIFNNLLSFPGGSDGRVIIIIHNGLPQGGLLLCLKRLTHPFPEVGHSRRYGLYTLNFSPSLLYIRIWYPSDFPGGSDGKESACNAGDLGLIPGLGRYPGHGNGNPLQYSCLESSMDRGALWAIVHGATESDIAESLLHPDPNKFIILKLLVCHLLAQLAFPIKLYSLPQQIVSSLTGLLCSKSTELGLGNIFFF